MSRVRATIPQVSSPQKPIARPSGRTWPLSGLHPVRGWHKRIECGIDRPVNRRFCPYKVEIWISGIKPLITNYTMQVLTAGERERFGRIRPSAARNSATAARILLRMALSATAREQVPPRDWCFTGLPFEKPGLSRHMPQYKFSVTHTERIVAVAVSQNLPIGIDAETIEQPIEQAVVTNFCSEEERSELNSLPKEQSIREFIRLWTLKEAYVKMTGRAIDHDLSSIGLSLNPASAMYLKLRSSDLPHFETLFVANGLGLTHLSIAIGRQHSPPGDIDLQIINVTDQQFAFPHVPCIRIQ